MPRRILIMMFVLACFAGALLLAGCGGGEAEQAEQAAPTGQPAGTAAEHPTEHVTEHPAATAVATHDCDGGCGMTAVPENQLTEIDGKWYCGGCVKKAQEDHTGHDHG